MAVSACPACSAAPAAEALAKQPPSDATLMLTLAGFVILIFKGGGRFAIYTAGWSNIRI